jgi:hypothetical protein
MNPKSTMGSVISQHHLQRIDAVVKRSSKTAGILAGGEPMIGVSELDGFDFSKGSFYPPTVIVDVGIEDEIWQEEVFGPVVVVKRFEVRLLPVPPFVRDWLLMNRCRKNPRVSYWRTLASMVWEQGFGRQIYPGHIGSLLPLIRGFVG